MTPSPRGLRAWGAGVEAATWLGLVPARVLSPRRGVPLSVELAERLGRSDPAPPPGRSPWLVHAVSAGEMSAASSLVAEMERRGLGLRALLATGTAAGRSVAETLRRRFPGVVTGVTYLPWDRPSAVRRWLARTGVEAVAVVEAEIWPGLFEAARGAGVPLAICSGRISAGEAGRYALVRPWFRRVLEIPGWIGVQTPQDASRFVRAGAPEARVVPSGNLKWDLPPGGRELPGEWEKALSVCRPGEFLVGASTHAPEEEILLDGLLRTRQVQRSARLVLAPRRVGRAGRIAGAARRRSLVPALLSEAPPAAWDVLVVDSFGHLPEVYRHAAAAYVGGSLTRHGGHSPCEPALSGLPLLMGPSDWGCRAESRLLEREGALLRVGADDPAAAVAAYFVALLSDRESAERARAASRTVAAGLRGASSAAVDAILALVASSRSRPGAEP